MRILVLDSLLGQMAERRLAAGILRRIYSEFETLAGLEQEGYNAIRAYLLQNNGREMQGATGLRIFKYRLNAGDRILYTYGRYLPYLMKHMDSLVLLSYAKHDDQAFIANHMDFQIPGRDYRYVKDIVRELHELAPDTDVDEKDLYAIAELIVSDSFKGYEISDDELINFSPEEIEKHLILSEEQAGVIAEYCADPQPTAIMGGAGTGKTLIAVHLLNALKTADVNRRAIYFTQSNALLGKIKKQYSQLKSEGGNVDFYDINQFCLDKLGIGIERLFLTNQFKEQFYRDYLPNANRALMGACENERMTVEAIWTEIRGTIKGGMPGWARVRPCNQNNVGNVRFLCKHGYVRRTPYNNQLLELSYSIKETKSRMRDDPELSQEDIHILEKIIKHYSEFDPEMRIVDREYYVSLNDEYSLFRRDHLKHRELVFEVCKEYEKYLQDNDLLDENDLVRAVLCSGIDEGDCYDIVFADEVQDYTELQIYLLKRLSSNNNIVFAGDVHQIINPTLFGLSKLKSLFADNTGTALRQHFLTTNFRCQKGVVDVANNISTLRRERLGRQAAEFEQAERTRVTLCTYDPCRLTYSEENLLGILKETAKYPQAVILVPDKITKSKLHNRLGDLHRPEFIFTVDEIKGMEYSSVVCYNLIDHSADVWNTILNEDRIADRTRYRFDFNLLYVAVTRSRQLLYFVDEHPVTELDEKIGLNKVEEIFNAELLHFPDMNNSLDAWKEQAEEYFNNGDYKLAEEFYNMAGCEENSVEILRCQAGIAEDDRDYDKAARCRMLIILKEDGEGGNEEFDQDDFKETVRRLDDSSPMKQLGEFVTGESSNVSGISKIIEKEFSKTKEEDRNLIYKRCCKMAEKLLKELTAAAR